MQLFKLYIHLWYLFVLTSIMSILNYPFTLIYMVFGKTFSHLKPSGETVDVLFADGGRLCIEMYYEPSRFGRNSLALSGPAVVRNENKYMVLLPWFSQFDEKVKQLFIVNIKAGRYLYINVSPSYLITQPLVSAIVTVLPIWQYVTAKQILSQTFYNKYESNRTEHSVALGDDGCTHAYNVLKSKFTLYKYILR